MRLKRLIATDFRNLAPLDLVLDAQFVVFHGRNAQGKTNLLESIYLLATLKPLRARRNRELVQWEKKVAVVRGDVEAEHLTRRHEVQISGKGRTISIDGKRAIQLQDYFASIRAIAFVPADADIVLGEPARRRDWLDRAAFTRSPVHLNVVRTFRRTLMQKSAALREGNTDRALLDVMDVSVAREGARLVHRRVQMLRALEPHAASLYQEIAGEQAVLSLSYKTAFLGDTVEETETGLLAEIGRRSKEEQRRQRCLIGPQRDGVALLINGVDARSFGSRGQVRSLVLSLKLAELVVARERGEVPLFLLDDVSSELDGSRTAHLMSVLRALDAQVFATTTDPDQLGSLSDKRSTWLEVEAGQVLQR